MNKNKIAAIILALGLGQLAGTVMAEPEATLNFCTKLSGTITAGTVGASQEKVI